MTQTNLDHVGHDGDKAPGEEHLGETGAARDVLGYVVGLVLASGLSAASFYAAESHTIWGPAIPAALVALAIAQMGVHLVFFLHITTGSESTNNVLALAFGVLIVFLLLAGSLFIMSALNHRMPLPDMVMQMQR